MADDHPVLQHLRAIRSDLGSLEQTLAEHGQWLNRIEQGIAGLRGDQALDAENAAHQVTRMDRLAERISRIERRLEIVDD